MKLFISWSGERSKKIAEALREWIPSVLQSVNPWVSGYDIDKGSRWSSEISLQLKEACFGIICLTPENLDAPWVQFEAGALSKSLDRSFVCPYLFGFDHSDLRGPLVQFQAAKANKEDTKKLIQSLNRALEEHGLQNHVLDSVFEKWWPDLDARLTHIGKMDKLKPSSTAVTTTKKNILSGNGSHTIKSDRDILNEILKRLSSTSKQGTQQYPSPPRRDYVFVVHGHNEGLKESVARFIEKTGLDVIILHEQPNQGRTIIEKFENYSNVGYAIVLLSGDDHGGVIDDTDDILRPRARQNVIFELGYFIAKLGRNKVCALYEDGVEVPSDYSGVLYIQIDDKGVWKFALARELRTAGLPADLNKAL